MIDGSENRNRQLAFEFHNSHVCEKRSNIMGDELRQQSWIFDMFTAWIVSIENFTLSNVQTLNLAYTVQTFSDFFGKIPVRILLDVLLRVQVF